MGLAAEALAAGLLASIAGGVGCGAIGGAWQSRRGRRRLLEISTGNRRGGSGFLCGGLHEAFLEEAVRVSRADAGSLPPWAYAGAARLERAAIPAGLARATTREGLVRTRLLLAAAGGACGCLAGSLFSGELAVLGSGAGFLWGWSGMARALRAERDARRRYLEKHLSQAIEVICLGLRSGLSFDRSLFLYCDCFDTALARQLAMAAGEWASGLRTREEALRTVQASYDSRLLRRMVDGIVRSLRFGSPLADTLGDLAVEAREHHEASVKEQVAKAPVKMMVPVGTLILPSMLLLVMGPVLLELLV
ncbi:type II secretion system F family protein [Curtanaerobium respiraculi]|uniref:type II secretion system F family protein n=1 Tax=Curtanaerobium respiraculi TaxID=2949669 RepID=UPI0024B3667B|nr:type II secretion system F family protein [Curtanaerobium respiraculi]